MFLKNLPFPWYEIESDATTSPILSQQKRNGGGNCFDISIDESGGNPLEQ